MLRSVSRVKPIDARGIILIPLSFVVLVSSLTPAQARQSPSGWVEDDDSTTKSSPSAASSGSKKHIMLRGGVEHSEALPSLPSTLCTGARYQASSAAAAADDWYWIPDWLAGKWKRTEETVVSSHNFETGEDNHQPHVMAVTELADYGVQRDKFGGIWHCRLASGGLADMGSYQSVAIIQSQEPLEVDQDKVVMRDVLTELHVNPDTGVIIWSGQVESLTTFKPAQGGRLSLDASIKFFDENGKPVMSQENHSLETKIGDFSATNSYKGKDLRHLFKLFLTSHDKADYVEAN